MKYTLDYFEKLGACKPALYWFAKTFPDGATLDKIKAVIPEKDWLDWLTAFLPDIPLADRERLAAKSNSSEFWLKIIHEKWGVE